MIACPCGKALSAKTIARPSFSGLCHACWLQARNSDPELRRKKAETMRRRWADPQFRHRQVAATRQGIACEGATAKAARRASGRKLAASRAGNVEIPAGSEPRRRAGAKRTQTILGWCPPEHRARYRLLQSRHGAVEARCIIEWEVCLAEAGGDEGLARQLLRLRHGARLVERLPVPTATFEGTLGGVATGQLA